MRRPVFLVTAVMSVALVALAACGNSDAAADTPSPTVQAAQPTTLSTPTPLPAAASAPQVSEQRIKDLEFRISELERLLSVEDAMFSVTDDLTAIDGRLRFQQTCLNALFMVANLHSHTNDDPATPAPGEIRSSAVVSHADGSTSVDVSDIISGECSRAVDPNAVEALIAKYGLG